MPLDSSRDRVVKDKRKSHSFLPYDQAARRSNVAKAHQNAYVPPDDGGRFQTALKNWRPSIWNAFNFWKSDGASGEEVDENHEHDASSGPNDGPGSLDDSSALNGTNGSLNSSTESESSAEGFPNDASFTSNLSEGQVSALLTLQPSRHVHFKLPSVDQEYLNSRHSQSDQGNQQPTPATPVRQNQLGNYSPPIPPSSPLHRLAAPQQDPLTQVAEYIANRDGRRPLHHVEALGLNTLIQQSVYVAGRPTAARYPAQQHSDTISAASGLASSSVSPSPSPIRPTFTSPSTDITALVTSSSVPSTSDLQSISSVSQVSPSRSSTSPSRTLARNPNGTLHYQGGGSSRSRYRSSAFSASPVRKKVAFPRGFGDSPRSNGPTRPPDTPPPSDSKRRRVGEEQHSSTAQASGLTPAMTNGTGSGSKTLATPPTTSPTPLRFGMSSPGSRLLTNTPARPSPLRQSVRADSSSPSTASPGSMNDGSPRTKDITAESPSRARASEKASEIMAGIINNATPKKDNVPDLRNPYQVVNRSPSKRSRKPATTKAPRPPPRPAQTTGPPPPPPKKPSALETIQRTAPQAQTGSKRSYTGMPPLEPKSPATNGIRAPSDSGAGKLGSSAQTPVVIEIDEEEEEEEQLKRPPTKKQRQEDGEKVAEERKPLEVVDADLDGSASTSATEKVVRPSEVVEFDAERQSSSENKRPVLTAPFGKKVPTTRFQSVPKEPSPLRQSFQPDVPSSPPKDMSSPASSAPKLPVFTLASTSPFASTSALPPFAPASTLSSFAPAPAASTLAQVAAVPTPAVAHPPSPPTDWLAVAKKQVLDTPADGLPPYSFAFTSSVVTLGGYKSQRDKALSVPVHELPKFDFSRVSAPKVEIKAFDFKAAGMKPLVKSGWTCTTCFITNDNNATKCISCESTR